MTTDITHTNKQKQSHYCKHKHRTTNNFRRPGSQAGQHHFVLRWILQWEILSDLFKLYTISIAIQLVWCVETWENRMCPKVLQDTRKDCLCQRFTVIGVFSGHKELLNLIFCFDFLHRPFLLHAIHQI